MMVTLTRETLENAIKSIPTEKHVFVVRENDAKILINKLSGNITYLKNGFRYGHVYVLINNLMTSVLEVINKRMKEDIIKFMEGCQNEKET